MVYKIYICNLWIFLIIQTFGNRIFLNFVIVFRILCPTAEGRHLFNSNRINQILLKDPQQEWGLLLPPPCPFRTTQCFIIEACLTSITPADLSNIAPVIDLLQLLLLAEFKKFVANQTYKDTPIRFQLLDSLWIFDKTITYTNLFLFVLKYVVLKWNHIHAENFINQNIRNPL